MKTLADDFDLKNIKQENGFDINSLLTENKKVATFIGTNKSGTSFIINNCAQVLSNRGVNVAILDTTKNKDTYYIYTKNEEGLRKTATESIEGLKNGEAKGVKVNNNLTIYTALPGTEQDSQDVEPILETLLKNHSLILIDCDSKTPSKYFEYATEIYLVQTMDILTIQPLTEMLLELKNKRAIVDSKLRIIINKYIEMGDISIKKIIGGMSYYNDPTMTYMKELFDRNYAQYTTIPFEKEIYEEYLKAIANCDINLDAYSYTFKQTLNRLCNEMYPMVEGE